MKLPGFIGSSARSASAIQAGEQCVNLIKENSQTNTAKSGACYLPISGVVDFASLDDSPGRGVFAEAGQLFTVYGGTLYEVDADGTPHPRGAVLNDGRPVQMTRMTIDGANSQLGIAAGTKGYVLDLATNVLTLEVNDITFIGQLDGFFVGLDTVTGTLKISENLDGLTWDPSQIALRGAASDDFRAMIIVNREIFLWGSKTGEVWRNAGTTPFPFEQRGDAFSEIGITAIDSLARLGTTMAWLGGTERGSGQVYWMNGYTPEKISPEGLDWQIQRYKETVGISGAKGWSYVREGHEFYVLSFPGAGTWVFDTTTHEWTERGLWSPDAGDFIAYRPMFHAEAFDKNLVCDSGGNTLYAFSSTTYTDVGGAALRRVRRTPHVSDENRRLTFAYFELEADRGVGEGVGQGADPLVALRYSNDGGKTFGDERLRHVGKQGEYDKRLRWDRCGSGRDRVWEVSSSDPAPTRWLDAYVQVS